MSSLVQTVFSSMREALNRNVSNSESFTNVTQVPLVVLLMVVVAVELLLLFLGKFLYNNVLCKTVTALKPLPTIWHFLGLQVVVAMLLSACCARM